MYRISLVTNFATFFQWPLSFIIVTRTQKTQCHTVTHTSAQMNDLLFLSFNRVIVNFKHSTRKLILMKTYYLVHILLHKHNYNFKEYFVGYVCLGHTNIISIWSLIKIITIEFLLAKIYYNEILQKSKFCKVKDACFVYYRKIIICLSHCKLISFILLNSIT